MLDRGVAAAGVLLVAGVLAGCAATEPESTPRRTPDVVVPGAPGDEPRVAGSAELERLRRSPRPSELEINYVRMMMPHHEQALRMAGLAPQRAKDPRVRALAERIGGAQGPEIEAMRGWLASHAPHSGHGGHAAHGSMPGMATPEQLAQLEAVRGTEFDSLFLRLMTAHHEGAVTMATDLLKQGVDEQLHEMAQDVLATQNDEIATMRRLSGETGS